jgi:hypothetical protein
MKEILIRSERALSVMFVSNDGTYGYGAGMTFMGIGKGETALVYVPVEPLMQRAFIFSSLTRIGDTMHSNGRPIRLEYSSENCSISVKPLAKKSSSKKLKHFALGKRFLRVSTWSIISETLNFLA